MILLGLGGDTGGSLKQNNQTMKDLPLSEQPYEKCLAGGASVLTDAELLAVFIRSGTRTLTAVEVARELLSRYGRTSGLACLMNLNREELTALPGIGNVKAVELMAAAEMCRRMSRSRRKAAVSMNNPSSIADYFMEELCYLPQEEMHVAMFDTKNRLLHELRLSVGTVNASLVSPREVFLEALRHHAVYLVLLHNHPSGDPTPSEADIQLTERLWRVGEMMHIPVLDHIVIGDHRYVSMREAGFIRTPGRNV